MENKEEDEIRKRWEQEARDKTLREQRELEDRPRKRLREIEYSRGDTVGLRNQMIEGGMMTPDDETASEAGGARAIVKTKAKAKASLGKGNRKVAASRTAQGSRPKGKITEITKDDEEYIELD